MDNWIRSTLKQTHDLATSDLEFNRSIQQIGQIFMPVFGSLVFFGRSFNFLATALSLACE